MLKDGSLSSLVPRWRSVQKFVFGLFRMWHTGVNSTICEAKLLLALISIYPQRRRKRAHKGSENVKRKRAKASRSSAGRAGGSHCKRRQVEAVTLFEVVTMGRSAMQVRLTNPQLWYICFYFSVTYFMSFVKVFFLLGSSVRDTENSSSPLINERSIILLVGLHAH